MTLRRSFSSNLFSTVVIIFYNCVLYYVYKTDELEKWIIFALWKWGTMCLGYILTKRLNCVIAFLFLNQVLITMNFLLWWCILCLKMKFLRELPKNGTVIMKDLEGIKDDIIITTTKEWYYPDGDFNTYGIPKKGKYAFSNASRGLKGASIICRCYCVFYRWSREWIDSIRWNIGKTILISVFICACLWNGWRKKDDHSAICFTKHKPWNLGKG